MSPDKRKQAAAVWIRLAKCHDLVLKEVRQRVGKGATTLPQFDVLAQLYRHPHGVTATELSRALLVTAGNLTGIVDRLEARGLVTRTEQPHDRRVRLLRLTPKGRRLAAREVTRHEGWLTEIFSGLEVAEQQALVGALDALRQSLDHAPPPPASRQRAQQAPRPPRRPAERARTRRAARQEEETP